MEGGRPTEPARPLAEAEYAGLLLPVDYSGAEGRARDLRSPASRLVSDPHSRSSGAGGDSAFNSRSAPEPRSRAVAETSRYEGRTTRLAGDRLSAERPTAGTGDRTGDRTGAGDRTGDRAGESAYAMQGGYLYEPAVEPRYASDRLPNAASSNESLLGSSRKKCDSTDADSDTSPKAGINERSKSFSPEASVKKIGPRGSLSQISTKNLRQNKPQSTPGGVNDTSVSTSAGAPMGSKTIYSRKFLSLKTLRVQGLPGYALSHARAFEWLGKYGSVQKLVVVDKSPTSVLDVEYATMESARLCILDAHGSIIRTGNGENEFRIRVCPSVVHFCPQYLHGLTCHNPRCVDLHTSETCDWIRALSATASSRQISEIKRDIVRELRAPWKASKCKPKLLGESEQATYHKLKLHDHAAQIIQYSPVLNQLYTHQSFL
ncbi:hypothetical protein GNI_059190 [Gregarina niphandrodes]|uniref:C3H1-type domain-containing protein n=1 Tax=Gregarina niphandrodes TaxID=110365 RepID=A0A023B8I8_GRENI|nr:hypothetical protein GNI_059190 [Gregarina niphandrodes]EZG69204.1 hypothetical protein GNI_059190 [Gregarina niphandrodes]|eukprot:XP_011134464.1 hypothetical protein GNI_059190 [Gregarina niphandrodes]